MKYLLSRDSALSASFLILLVTQNSSAQQASVYLAGEIEYARQSFPIASDTLAGGLTADLDGDGDSDYIVTAGTIPSEGGNSRGPQEGLILFNNGDNTFTLASGDAPKSESAREILVEDFNGDGILDFYIADHGYDAAPYPGFRDQLLLGTGDGFTDISHTLPDIAAFTHNGAVGDIDGDGDIDILALNSDDIESELSYFLINDGSANFTLDRNRLPLTLSSLQHLRNSYAAELADLDADGFPEMIIGRRDNTNLTPTRIHWNDGQGQFNDSDVTYLDEIDVFGSFEAVHVIDIKGRDFDGDGKTDLLLNSYDGNFVGTSIQLFMNSGNRVFRNETRQRLGNIALNPDPDFPVPYFLNVLDVNGDGHVDLVPMVSYSTQDDSLFLYEGMGNGCYQPITKRDVTPESTVDSDLRRELGNFPILSEAGFGYGSFSSILSNGEQRAFFNYVPVSISAKPVVSNYLHNCSGKVKISLTVDGQAMYTLDLILVSTDPQVIVQVDATSISDLTEPREKMAAFNSTTGRLTIPELHENGAVIYRNLSLIMTDAASLQLTLESVD